MMGLFITVHVIACILLVVIILIQAGRGGGLVEGATDLESVFGTKTNSLLTRSTTILSIVFFITCISLALFSARGSRSLMQNLKTPPAAAQSSQVDTKVGSEEAKSTKNTAGDQPSQANVDPMSEQALPPKAE